MNAFIIILNHIQSLYISKEKNCDEFKELSLAGMNFKNFAYYAKGLGNVAIMRIDDGKGIMKMDTIIINPFEIDAPMLSYDSMRLEGTIFKKTGDFETLNKMIEEYYHAYTTTL